MWLLDMERLNLRVVRKREEYKALARVDGNAAQVAKLLGVSRPTIYDLMSRYGLK